jgi:hypothetical protein
MKKNIKTFFYTLVGVNYKTLTLNYKGTEITLIDINNMSDEQKDEKQKFILKFNEYVESHEYEDFWMTPEKISGATGTTETQVVQYVESFDEFVKNSNGEYTTLEEYNKNTDLFRKILDQIRNKIK